MEQYSYGEPEPREKVLYDGVRDVFTNVVHDNDVDDEERDDDDSSDDDWVPTIV